MNFVPLGRGVRRDHERNGALGHTASVIANRHTRESMVGKSNLVNFISFYDSSGVCKINNVLGRPMAKYELTYLARARNCWLDVAFGQPNIT